MNSDNYSDDDFYDDDEEHFVSKTQIKKDMLALKDLGIAISELTPAQQAKIPLADKTRDAIEQAPNIKSNSAKKRHMQYIGKLLRGDDSEAIKAAFDEIKEDSHRSVRQHHLIEQWRDRLVQNDQKAMNEFIDSYPQVDRQQLRQLMRASQKEAQQNKPPASARKLFKFLRETMEA